MDASGFLITTQGTVRALEPWLPASLGSWRVKGQRPVWQILQSSMAADADLGGMGGLGENLYLSWTL